MEENKQIRKIAIVALVLSLIGIAGATAVSVMHDMLITNTVIEYADIQDSQLTGNFMKNVTFTNITNNYSTYVGENGLNLTMINVTDNGNYTYTWHYSDGNSSTTSNLRGAQGEQGIQGEPAPVREEYLLISAGVASPLDSVDYYWTNRASSWLTTQNSTTGGKWTEIPQSSGTITAIKMTSLCGSVGSGETADLNFRISNGDNLWSAAVSYPIATNAFAPNITMTWYNTSFNVPYTNGSKFGFHMQTPAWATNPGACTWDGFMTIVR